MARRWTRWLVHQRTSWQHLLRSGARPKQQSTVAL
jgi:hypothetical protein